METVLAIDPGERVGWAGGIIDPDGRSDRHPEIRSGLVIKTHGITKLKSFALKLGESFANYDTVIYESWRLYPGAVKTMIGNDMQTSQLIGIIRYLSWLHPNVKLHSQSASIKNTAIKIVPDTVKDILENAPGTHDDAHDMDALLHLSFYHWSEYVAKEQAG